MTPTPMRNEGFYVGEAMAASPVLEEIEKYAPRHGWN